MNYRIVGPSLTVFIIVTMIGFLLLGLMMRAGGPPPAGAQFLASLFIGSMAGLMLVVTIWSGLFGQSWIRSYLEAVALVTSAIVLMLITAARELPRDFFAVLLYVPLFGLTMSLPLWFMRYLGGWRLLCEMPPQKHNRSMGIEDILLLTTVIASAIMLSRSAVEFLSRSLIAGESMWFRAAFVSVIFGLVSAPISMIAARCALTRPQAGNVLATMFGLWLVSFFAFLMFVLAISRGQVPGEAIFFIFVGSISAFTVLGIGLACFIYDGNQLFFNRMTETKVADANVVQALNAEVVAEATSQTTDESAVLAPSLPPVHDHRATDPFSDEDTPKPELDKPPSRLIDRILAVAMLLVCFLFSMVAYLRGEREAAQIVAVEAAQNAQISLLAAYGKAELQDGAVYQFKAKSISDDGLVVRLQEHDQLHTLDLSNSKVSNIGAALAAQFSNLQVLDLADTSIDDNVFENIPPGKFQLQSLNLSRTKVTGKGLIEIAKTIRCAKLIVNGLSLMPEEIDRISSLDQTLLDLRDVQLSALPRRAKHLYLGSNGVSAESIVDLSKDLKTLQIDSMNVTDEIFDQFIKSHPMLTTIGLANTPQTGKSLASLKNHPNLQKLSIGQGTSITEQDLIDHQPSVLNLEIRDPDFRGSFLGSINSSVRVLDLSYSGVDDKSVQSIPLNIAQNLILVRLAHTKITHKSVQHLSSLGVREIDIRGTKINVNELVKSQFGFPTRLVVDPGQFTESDRVRVGQSSNFRLNYEESGNNTTSFILE